MTFEELENELPNGFHDAKILAVELDYAAGTARFRLSLLVGWPDDPPSQRDEYQDAILDVTGLCFCSIDPPDPAAPFLPDGKGVFATGDPAAADTLTFLDALRSRCPEGASFHRFFVHDWNTFIHIAARDASVTWMGKRPRHAT